MTWTEAVASVATMRQIEVCNSKGLNVGEVVEMAYPDKADCVDFDMMEDEAELFLDTALVHSGIH